MVSFSRKITWSVLLSSLLGCLLVLAACSPDPSLLSNQLSAANSARRHNPVPKLTEFSLPTPGAQPWGITAGPDGKLWFSEYGANQIGSITQAGRVSEFSLPALSQGGGPRAITRESDGTLRFTVESLFFNVPGKVGSISSAHPSKSVTEKDLFLYTNDPESITTGPNHTLWFTGIGSDGIDKIGRMTSNGQFTEFDLPTPGSLPLGITQGPDGAMWFTESNNDKIGRIPSNASSSSQITEYGKSLTPGAGPQYITQGPDHALWFTEVAPSITMPDRIGRIDPSTHTIREFPLTTASLPQAIVVGPDGNLWFTESIGPTGHGGLGMIHPDTHKITEFDLKNLTNTGDPRPFGLTVGPDGALWFTEWRGNQIGRFTLTGGH